MATDSILRPGELKNLLLKEIQAADLADIDVREVGTVLEVKDGIARIYGLTSAMAGEMLEFTVSATGEKITGLALNLEEETRGGDLRGNTSAPRGHEVRRTARAGRAVGNAMVGRVVMRWVGRSRSRAHRTTRQVSRDRRARHLKRQPGKSRCRGVRRRRNDPVGRGQRELIIGDRGQGRPRSRGTR